MHHAQTVQSYTMLLNHLLEPNLLHLAVSAIIGSLRKAYIGVLITAHTKHTKRVTAGADSILDL